MQTFADRKIRAERLLGYSLTDDEYERAESHVDRQTTEHADALANVGQLAGNVPYWVEAAWVADFLRGN